VNTSKEKKKDVKKSPKKKENERGESKEKNYVES